MSIPITTELVKELRDATGVSVMQCRQALVEALGDMEKALLILKKKSSAIAMKKADRDASEGIIATAENADKTLLLTLHCETDFVAKNGDFVALAQNLANIALEKGVEAMKEASVEMINEATQKMGEKIEVGKVELVEGAVRGGYVHAGKSAVVVSLSAGTPELARDIAMHIAAMKPTYMTESEISADVKEKVHEMFAKDVAEVDKPEEIKAKMLEGKMNTYFKEQTLMDQPFIKNPDVTIGALLAKSGATLVKFVRESIG